jgi:hypothetical protein
METIKDIHFEFDVPVSPELAYIAIGKPREWWHDALDGDSSMLGDSFTVRFSDLDFVRFTVSEAQPGSRYVWHVEDCYLQWFENKTEWTGTDVVFDISPTADGSRVKLVHMGLTPEVECYEMCNSGWEGHFMKSLRNFMVDGVGSPKAKSGE